MPTTDEVLRWLVLYAAVAFAAFTVLLIVRSWRRVGRPRWPLHSRWVIVLLVGSWGGRVIDLALARGFGFDLNAPHTILWWLVMNVSLTWIGYRVATGRLILEDVPRRRGRGR